MEITRPRQAVALYTPHHSRQVPRTSAPSIPPRRSSMAALKNDTRSHQHVSQRPSSKDSSVTELTGRSGSLYYSNVASASGSSNLSDPLVYSSTGSVRSQMGSPGGPPRETKTSTLGGLRALRRTLSPFPHQAFRGLSPAPSKGLYSSPRRGKRCLSRCLPRLLRRKRPLRILPPWSRLGEWRLRTAHSRLPRQECPICTEQQCILHFPQRAITATCTHEAIICLGCISQSITAQLETMVWDQLACPLCPALLTYADMKAWAKGKDFER